MSGGLGPAHRVETRSCQCLSFDTYGLPQWSHVGAGRGGGALTSKSCDTFSDPSPPALFLRTIPGLAARCAQAPG